MKDCQRQFRMLELMTHYAIDSQTSVGFYTGHSALASACQRFVLRTQFVKIAHGNQSQLPRQTSP
jgi:hypothetical protein